MDSDDIENNNSDVVFSAGDASTEDGIGGPKLKLSLLGNRKQKKLLSSAMDSKSSSATMTPVSKTFPRQPFSQNEENSTTTTTAIKQQLVAELTSSNQSQSGSSTNTVSPSRLVSQSSSLNSPSPATPNSSKSKSKQTFSLISQLSDDLMSDVASKARTLSANFSSAANKNSAGSFLSSILSENGESGDKESGIETTGNSNTSLLRQSFSSILPSSISNMNLKLVFLILLKLLPKKVCKLKEN